jgi:hypothetical protein
MNALSEIRVPAAPIWLNIAELRGRPLLIEARPKLFRSQRNPNTAQLRLPRDIAKTRRVSIYHDGGHKIGLVFRDSGERSVGFSAGQYRIVSIPRSLVDLIPFGTHEVTISDENGMRVIDLLTIPAA